MLAPGESRFLACGRGARIAHVLEIRGERLDGTKLMQCVIQSTLFTADALCTSDFALRDRERPTVHSDFALSDNKVSLAANGV